VQILDNDLFPAELRAGDDVPPSFVGHLPSAGALRLDYNRAPLQQ
jgi:hypothetical protein